MNYCYNTIDTDIKASEEVFDKYTDTAGNLHWTGTHSGEHIIKTLEIIDKYKAESEK